MPQAHLENNITLEYDIHGSTDNPIILIILGITDNITDWPPGLYEPLVAAGYCVVRYELRDSGLSSKIQQAGYPDLAAAGELLKTGKLPNASYTVHDMVSDAKLLLAHLKIEATYLVGYSYGSMVAQLLALDAPEHIKGLVCLQGSNYNPDLPPRTKEVEQAMLAATLEYESTEEKIQTIKNLRIATNGTKHFLDDPEALHSATLSVSRMYYPQGTARIVLSRFATKPFFNQTQNITCPTLILHGDDDPIFNIKHGQDMAERIPDARLIVLEGVGHNHPLTLQPIITGYIIDFLQAITN